jgi:hypothetical protein
MEMKVARRGSRNAWDWSLLFAHAGDHRKPNCEIWTYPLFSIRVDFHIGRPGQRRRDDSGEDEIKVSQATASTQALHRTAARASVSDAPG